MNREVHVRFWESAGLQCLAPLARDTGGLMCELHSASDSERAGLEYLERVARGMETLK